MRLASQAQCSVPLAKLQDYILNAAHPDGAPKARFFASFGFSTARLEVFATALINLARDNDIKSEIPSPYGVKYVVECNLETPDSRNPCVITVWIAENGNGPRLVTAYPR